MVPKRTRLEVRALQWAVLGFLLSVSGAFAQDPSPNAESADDAAKKIERLLKKVDANLYSPAAEVDDLRFRLSVPVLDQMLPDARIEFLWRRGKKEGQSQAFLELELDSPMKPSIQAQVKQQAGRLAGVILRPPLTREFRDAELELTRDGSFYRLSIVPGPESDANWISRVLWIGADFLPKRATTQVAHPDLGSFTEETTYEWALYGDEGAEKRRVLASITTRSPVGEHAVYFEYGDVDGITLARRMEIHGKLDPTGPVVIELADLEINKGIPDEAFQ